MPAAGQDSKPAIHPYQALALGKQPWTLIFYHRKIIEISGGTIPALSGEDDAIVKGSVRQIAQEKDPRRSINSWWH
jgi:hypothetical protein